MENNNQTNIESNNNQKDLTPAVIININGNSDSQKYTTLTSDKSKKTTLYLCCLGFLGLGGIHDFYLGKFGSGLIKLFTGNWFFIGTFIDLIKISTGGYRDNVNLPIRK